MSSTPITLGFLLWRLRGLARNPVIVLGIDPGETTGVCVLKVSSREEDTKVISAEQLSTKSVGSAGEQLRELIKSCRADFVVYEDYKVYGWKSKSHAWSELHTPKVIGALEYILYVLDVPHTKQSAQEGKAFCTDDKLKEWGFYIPGKPHAMDAVRHACQAVLFSQHPFFNALYERSSTHDRP